MILLDLMSEIDELTAHLAMHPSAGMAELAAAVGVSRATLFRRFPSRESLVAAASRRAVERYADAVETAAPEDGPSGEALTRVIRGLAAIAPTHGLLALQVIPAALEAELLATAQAVDDRILSIVRRGQRAGELRTDFPPAWVLTMLTWLCIGAADGLRLGTLAPADVERLFIETVHGALESR